MMKDEMANSGESFSGTAIAIEYYGSDGDSPVVWVTDAQDENVQALRLDAGLAKIPPTVPSIMLSAALVYRLWGIGLAWTPISPPTAIRPEGLKERKS
jgi:hypothetical protein